MIKGIRTTPLSPEEKDELNYVLSKLHLMPHSGQIVVHVNEGKVTAIQPQAMIR